MACRGQGSGSVAVSKPTPLWTLKATQLLIFAANVCLIRYITVYYDQIGLSRREMGFLLVVMPLVAFWGQLFWSAVVDRLGECKRTLIITSLVGVAVVFTYLLPCVKGSLPILTLVTMLHGFFASPSGPIVDALCLKVLSEQGVTEEAYGDQRLWSAIGWGGMALVSGHLIDVFGTSSMFFCFAALVLVNVAVIAVWMPGQQSSSIVAAEDKAAQQASAAAFWGVLRTFEARWLLLNLLIYGVLMALVENFLNVFLLQDFIGTPTVLIGLATAVMCTFEIPVFKYIGKMWRDDTSGVVNALVACEAILALRCCLYMVLPRHQPWLVLLVEPLHGITFAGMWCASVEYARRLAPPGAEAKMQALVNGLFYQISFAAGSFLWGILVQRPPRGLGFSTCFLLDAVLIVGWLGIWRVGWALGLRWSGRRG